MTVAIDNQPLLLPLAGRRNYSSREPRTWNHDSMYTRFDCGVLRVVSRLLCIHPVVKTVGSDNADPCITKSILYILFVASHGHMVR
jgi:hypothetical protein